MKVGILTWYKAINHGALLQAYASSQVIKSFGAEPVILDYQWELNRKKDAKKRILRCLRFLALHKLGWYLKLDALRKAKKQHFSRFMEENLCLGRSYAEEPDLDAVYIGSDMVFDISEGFNPYMYGEGVAAPYIFSYAASFGYSDMDRLHQSGHYDRIRQSLSSLKEIGYRDEKTRQMCQTMGITVPMCENIDPVLCYGYERETEEWDSGRWADQNYLLIYAYDSTMNDDETVRAIRNYAKEKQLKLISCGYYHSWCDECIPAAPDEFLEMFKHAACIVTDTFHGTVFSTLLHKRFVTILRSNGFKVQYLLQCGHLEDRILKNPDSLAGILTAQPDYSDFDRWLSEARSLSRNYIKRNLDKARELKD